MRRRRGHAGVVALVLAALAVSGLLVGAAIDHGFDRASSQVAVGAAPGAIEGAEFAAVDAGQRTVTFAAVGDSITNANSVDFHGLRVGDKSWVSYANGRGVTFVGGWARGGAQTAAMAENAVGLRADVLVLIAGTNDVAHGVPFAVTARNLLTIADRVGAGRVLVSAVPPRNATPAAITAFNAHLASFVATQGWTFVDAMVGVRAGELYAEGMTDDGIHPSREAAQVIGAALAIAIAE